MAPNDVSPTRSHTTRVMLRWASLFLIIAALLMLAQQFAAVRGAPAVLPPGSTVAGIPSGNLTVGDALARVQTIYTGLPLQLVYQDAVIQVSPADLGFTLDEEAMSAEVTAQASTAPLAALSNRLWKKPSSPVQVELRFSFDAGVARAFLEKEIAPRYDQPAAAAIPVPASSQFTPGASGRSLDIDATVPLIEPALTSIDQRSVVLPVITTPAAGPSIDNLQIALQQLIQLDGFDGLVEIYFQDLRNGQIMHFARQANQPIEPGIAFTAASTIKIPIMISVLRRTQEPVPDQITSLLEGMIIQSENPPADELMQRFLGGNLGPLVVTEDIQALGLENTFLAGYFYDGAPLLQRFETPANQRQDINLQPDAYDQTTPDEMGRLLAEIHHCAKDGTGKLIETFPGEMTASKCQLILDYLGQNRTGLLIEAGVPGSARVAHKHGWIPEADGLLHTMSDVAVVSSQGGDFVLAVYLYDTGQLVFDPANRLVAELTQTVYNYMNVAAQ